MKKTKNQYGTVRLILMVLSLFCLLSPLYAQSAQRAPINVNLIIDGSSSYSGVKDEATSWVITRLDQILADGDRVTVWSAGTSARIIYTGTVSSSAERDAVKKSIREMSVSGNTADFAGALRDAQGRQSSGFSYTLLISASPQALSSVISGSSLLKYSRVEDFSSWRALVVGLNLDTRVKRASDSFFGS